MSLSGKITVLTAAANEIGAGCAQYLAGRGASVVVIDQDLPALEALCQTIRGNGGQATPVQADPKDFDQLVAAGRAHAADGRIDILVTCPMDVEAASIEASSIESWRRVIDNDLLGPVVAAKAMLPFLKAASNAAIVHLGSIDGILGNPQVPSYSAAKGGMVALTHVMADEFAAFGIRVNCVARAMAMGRNETSRAVFKPIVPHTPLGRPGYFDEIGSAVAFLASAEASYITGVVLPVDGGRSVITPGTRPAPRAR